MTEFVSLLRRGAFCGLLGLAATLAAVEPLDAQRIDNAVAVFATLDKVTARISRLEVRLNQSAQFGSLKVTPRACYSRPPTEPPKTSGFVEVVETQLDGQQKRIFSGWMFAESPGLNAVEHPVFDVWLTECAQPTRPAAAAATPAPAARGAATATARGGGAAPPAAQPGRQPQPIEGDPEEPLQRRRVRR